MNPLNYGEPEFERVMMSIKPIDDEEILKVDYQESFKPIKITYHDKSVMIKPGQSFEFTEDDIIIN